MRVRRVRTGGRKLLPWLSLKVNPDKGFPMRPVLLCKSESLRAGLAGVLLGTLVSALFFKTAEARRPRFWGERKRHKEAFVLIVTVTFKTAGDREKAINIWRPLAEHVARHETGALLYEAARCDRDERKLIFIERCPTVVTQDGRVSLREFARGEGMEDACRYVDREENYVRVHRNSEAYKTFFALVSKETEVETKEGISGYEVDYGLA